MHSNDREAAPTGVFEKEREDLRTRLHLGAMQQGDHLLWMERDAVLYVPAWDDWATTHRTAAQVSWFLHTGTWEPHLYSLCEHLNCLTPEHLSTTPWDPPWDPPPAQTDEQLLALVETHSVSLADLYRRGRARGLLAPRTAYQ